MNIPTADQTAELWLKIDQLHLNFLKAEENTRKIDIRKRLEGWSICWSLSTRFKTPI